MHYRDRYALSFSLCTLAYGNLAGLFLEAIKELKGELDALKKKVGV
jgi:hypothetical protein